MRTGVYGVDVGIWIENGRIREVGPFAAVSAHVPAGALAIDLSGKTVLPGLVDCHTHLLSRAPDTSDGYLIQLATKSQAARALDGAANASAVLRAGFTTVRDVGNEGADFADVALRDAIAQGLVEGPRMLVATRAIGAVGQYLPFGVSPDLVGFPTGIATVSGVEEARRAVREQIGHGANLIKLYADWDHPTLTIEEMRVVVEEAHGQGRRVAAHATTAAGIWNALQAGVDSIEHGFGLDDRDLAEMRRRGTTLVPTLDALEAVVDVVPASSPSRSRAEAALASARAGLLKARALGIPIAVGFDASTADRQGRSAEEIVAMTRAGLPPIDAIRGATVAAARLLGLETDVGTLEPGRYGDLIAVDGDPLTDATTLEHVTSVLKGGVLVTGVASHVPADAAPVARSVR